MRHRVRSRPLHAEAWLERARASYTELCGQSATIHREAEIRGLPSLAWRGQLLRTLRCHGSTGKGPHDHHVPEALCWSLIDLHHFYCAFHRQ